MKKPVKELLEINEMRHKRLRKKLDTCTIEELDDVYKQLLINTSNLFKIINNHYKL